MQICNKLNHITEKMEKGNNCRLWEIIVVDAYEWIHEKKTQL